MGKVYSKDKAEHIDTYISMWVKENKMWKLFFNRGLFSFKTDNDQTIPLFTLQATEISAVDIAFYQKCSEDGIAPGFYAFMDDSGLVLSGNTQLLTKSDYKDLAAQSSPPSRTSPKLIWKPSFSYTGTVTGTACENLIKLG